MINNKTKYLISAIVSVYNCERFLEGCLDNLLNQTIADKIEIVVVNSGSQENEERIIKDYQNRHNNIIYLKTEERETIYAAWNRGIKASSGKYITNANSDDRHRKDAFEIMSRILDNNDEIELVYPSYRITHIENDSFENSPSSEYYTPPAYNRHRLLFQCLPGPFPLWRKSVLDAFGYFDESYHVAGDHEFWLRMSNKCKLYHINEFLGLYYRNPDGGEFRDQVLTKKEAVHLTNRYIELEFIPEHQANLELIREIRKKQSDFLFWAADFFFFRDKPELAKKYALKSLSYKGNYIKNIKILVYCMLPRRCFNIIQSMKKNIKLDIR